jgi:hemin uptake protein HemP
MDSEEKVSQTPVKHGEGMLSTTGVRRVQLAEWMGEARVLEIEHEAQVYRLTLTRQGKLILTK